MKTIIKKKYDMLKAHFNEKERRLWAASEAIVIEQNFGK